MGISAFRRRLQAETSEAPMLQIGILPGKYVNRYWEYLSPLKCPVPVFKFRLTILQSTSDTTYNKKDDSNKSHLSMPVRPTMKTGTAR